MRFAMATNDAYQCVLESLLGSGWQLTKLFVSPGDRMHDSKRVVERALALEVPVQQSPIDQQALADLRSRDCGALVVASYRWKIPDWQEYLPYAVNFHPSPLPEGRGPYPLVRAILEERRSWAVTCHRISERFDEGAILDSEPFAMQVDEHHATLRLKVQMAAARLGTRVAAGFAARWMAAVPQKGGSYWERWTEEDRNLDFNLPVHAIIRTVRAFGDIECSAEVNGVRIFIHSASGWTEAHAMRPGAVAHSNDLALVVAASDGYVAITEWSFHPPGAITACLRR